MSRVSAGTKGKRERAATAARSAIQTARIYADAEDFDEAREWGEIALERVELFRDALLAEAALKERRL